MSEKDALHEKDIMPEVDGEPVDESPDALAAEEVGEPAVDEAYAAVVRERDDWRDKAYRAAAEAENVRKRAAADVADARQYGLAKFAADVLGVGDNLARALAAPEGNEKALRDGVAMTAAQLQSMLERHGIKMVEAKAGTLLNPEFHQAMSEIESEDVPPGCIVQELQAGFTINGRLLRPSLVVVAKRGAGISEQ